MPTPCSPLHNDFTLRTLLPPLFPHQLSKTGIIRTRPTSPVEFPARPTRALLALEAVNPRRGEGVRWPEEGRAP